MLLQIIASHRLRIDGSCVIMLLIGLFEMIHFSKDPLLQRPASPKTRFSKGLRHLSTLVPHANRINSSFGLNSRKQPSKACLVIRSISVPVFFTFRPLSSPKTRREIVPRSERSRGSISKNLDVLESISRSTLRALLYRQVCDLAQLTY